MRGRGEGRWHATAVTVAVWSSVLLLFGMAAIGGVASIQVTSGEARVARQVAVVGRMPALAGEIAHLAAVLADPTTDPAKVDALRARLRADADTLESIAQRTARGVPDGAPMRSQSSVAPLFAETGLGLSTRLAGFCMAARRASQPGTDLSLGSLTRGGLDGEVVTSLVADLAVVVDAVAGDNSARAQSWRRTVTWSLVGLGIGGLALAGIVVGPVSSGMRRARREQSALLRERELAATHIAGVLDGVGVAVMACDATGTRVDLNEEARLLYNLSDAATVTAGSLRTRLRDPQDPALDQPCPLEQVLASGTAWDGELLLADDPTAAADTHPMPDSTSPPRSGRRLQVHARPLRNHEGTMVGAVSAAHDVTDTHARHELLRRHAAQLAAIDAATRAVLREPDARAAVCRTACSVSGGSVAFLVEPDGHGDLVVTASSGADLLGMRMPQAGPTMTARVFAEARPRVVEMIAGRDDVDAQITAQLSRMCGRDVTAAIWTPVIAEGRSRAVLAVGYSHPEERLADHVTVLGILATETAVALERQNLLLRLEAEAVRDGLTGAGNRRAWDTALTEAIRQAGRSKMPLSAVILDLDRFKAFNDTHGHPAGDALLREAVTAWQQRLRPTDMLCRYGGEEFTVLLPGCTTEQALTVTESLRALVPRDQTCSAGIATWDGHEDATALLQRADAALYQAKTQGRDTTVTAC